MAITEPPSQEESIESLIYFTLLFRIQWTQSNFVPKKRASHTALHSLIQSTSHLNFSLYDLFLYQTTSHSLAPR